MRHLTFLAAGLLLLSAACSQAETPRPLPEFTATAADAWINSAPLQRDDLLGRVTLIDVWTFDCWNCYRSFPWLTMLEADLADQPFQVIGIHSPEFDHEHERARVEAKVRDFGLQHAVMMDNDFAFWRALGNRYWPTFYLVDKAGNIRHRHVGETHAGTARAREIEDQVRALLAD